MSWVMSDEESEPETEAKTDPEKQKNQKCFHNIETELICKY